MVDEIRAVPGHELFLKRPRFEALRAAAEGGAIIIVNITARRSDALLLLVSANSPISVPLPDIDVEKVVGLYNRLAKVRAAQVIRQGDIRQILRDLWSWIVEPVVLKLESLGVPHGSRIWWCPTWLLWSLPLHAAGTYKAGERRNLPDLYVSSYTPTIGALLHARQATQARPPLRDLSMLVVSQPSTPGQAELPCVDEEVATIMSLVDSVTSLNDREGTRTNVLNALGKHSWLHLSCHGEQDLENPLDSRFLLYDGPITLLDLVRGNLSKADFAFLSACYSAANDVKMSEEGLHLAGGLQVLIYCYFLSCPFFSY